MCVYKIKLAGWGIPCRRQNILKEHSEWPGLIDKQLCLGSLVEAHCSIQFNQIKAGGENQIVMKMASVFVCGGGWNSILNSSRYLCLCGRCSDFILCWDPLIAILLPDSDFIYLVWPNLFHYDLVCFWKTSKHDSKPQFPKAGGLAICVVMDMSAGNAKTLNYSWPHQWHNTRGCIIVAFRNQTITFYF